MSLVPIVSDQDEIITYKERGDIDYAVDIFRTASVWVTNSQGDILLAQRSFDKKVDPGKWGEAVGGTVEGDDSYKETARREVAEELGLLDVELHDGPKQLVKGDATYFVQWYKAKVDVPVESFMYQEDELEAIAWFAKDDLQKDIGYNPGKYIQGMENMLELLELA